MSYVIEANVPVPMHRNAKTNLGETIRALNVGDSFFIEGKRPSHIGNIFVATKPKKFMTRTVDGGTRVWRLA